MRSHSVVNRTTAWDQTGVIRVMELFSTMNVKVPTPDLHSFGLFTSEILHVKWWITHLISSPEEEWDYQAFLRELIGTLGLFAQGEPNIYDYGNGDFLVDFLVFHADWVVQAIDLLLSEWEADFSIHHHEVKYNETMCMFQVQLVYIAAAQSFTCCQSWMVKDKLPMWVLLYLVSLCFWHFDKTRFCFIVSQLVNVFKLSLGRMKKCSVLACL